MIVTDASAVVLALGQDGPAGEAARERLSGERLVAPELLDVEVVSAWRRHEAAGRLDPKRAALRHLGGIKGALEGGVKSVAPWVVAGGICGRAGRGCPPS